MAKVAQIAAGVAVELFLFTIAFAVLYRVWGWFFTVPKRQLVQTFQQGLCCGMARWKRC